MEALTYIAVAYSGGPECWDEVNQTSGWAKREDTGGILNKHMSIPISVWEATRTQNVGHLEDRKRHRSDISKALWCFDYIRCLLYHISNGITTQRDMTLLSVNTFVSKTTFGLKSYPPTLTLVLEPV